MYTKLFDILKRYVLLTLFFILLGCPSILAITACGLLVEDSVGCIFFVSNDSGSFQVELDNYGDFIPGDFVEVTGTFDPLCENSCVSANGCIINNTIEQCDQLWPYSGCGMLMQGSNCILFQPTMGGQGLLKLENYGTFIPGNIVCVSGTLTMVFDSLCPEVNGYVFDNTIDSTGGQTMNFDDCGVLVADMDTLLFSSLNNPESYFILDNYANFQNGDTVCVSGMLSWDCLDYFPSVDGCVVNNTISSYSPFGPYFSGFGVLEEIGSCLYFFEVKDSLFYMLDNYFGFNSGDSVYVDGILNLGCQTDCLEAVGCIEYNIVIPLTNSNPNTLIIEINPACIIDSIIYDYQGIVIDTLYDSYTYLVEFPGAYNLAMITELIMNHPCVYYVHPDYLMSIPEVHQMSTSFPDESMPTYMQGVSPEPFYDQITSLSLGIDSAQLLANGEEVIVAVLDNGLDLSHPLFETRIDENSYDFIDDDFYPDEEPGEIEGHGSFVSGIIALVAPECKLMPLRIFDGDGVTSSFVVVEAIYWAINNNADIINMSFGSYTPNDAIEQAIRDAYNAGITVVSSVGNDSVMQAIYPAAYDEVIAVSAIDTLEEIAGFSNGGSYIDVTAPGVNLYSVLSGTCEWGTWSGTSFSAPYVTGACALMLNRNPDLLPLALKQTVQLTARTELNSGSVDPPDMYYGYGCIDVYNSVLTWAKGDVDNSGDINVSDLTLLVDFIFKGGPPPMISNRLGDVDCDDEIFVSDLTALVDYLFKGISLDLPCSSD